MKKSVLLFTMMLFALCFQSKAQDWTDMQHEVSLSYGGLPVADLLHHYERYFDPSAESVDLYDDKGKFGALNISYLFYIFFVYLTYYRINFYPAFSVCFPGCLP